jgi:medium-chain acyl-[acyl-carrier-protein] hydrolase
LREAPFTRIPALVESAVAALQPHFDRPFALFGHSMGALVAFEVATALVARRGARPLHLFVSGHRAPHLPRRHPPLAHLPHDAFVAEVRSRYDGIPDEVFHMPELMELLVPTLRADMEAIEHYTHAESPPLACPITAYGGADDAQATEAEIAAWRQYTASRFRHQSFPGAHFFVQTCRASLAADIVSALGSPAHGASGGARRSAE